MISRIAVSIASFVLRKVNLSTQDRINLTDLVLDKIVAFPIHDIIVFNEEGTLLVNGNPLDIEKALALRESAKGALNNSALELVHNQIRYESMKNGINSARIIEDTLFAKAAIWIGEQERILLRKMIGPEEN